MVHKVLAPIKPTGGAIGIATIVGLAGAAACTQFLTLNMPFGGERRAIIFPARPISIPLPPGWPRGRLSRVVHRLSTWVRASGARPQTRSNGTDGTRESVNVANPGAIETRA